MALSQPGAGDVHVDKLLTNISVAYTNDDYIAQDIFPMVPVEKQSDLIGGYDKADWLRSVMAPWQPGTRGARSGFRVNKDKNYFCRGWKIGKEIPIDVLENADQPFDIREAASRWVKEQVQLRWELEFAQNFFASSKGWQDKTGGTHFVQWSNYAGSNPIVDLRLFSDLVRQKTARKLNTWVYSKVVWDVLVDHPLIVDRLKYTSRESLTPDMLARMVGYDKTKIGSAIYVSSGEAPFDTGVATAPTVAEVWGKHALGLFVPDRPSLLTPAAGYTFTWKSVVGTPLFIRRLRDDELEIEIIEGKSYFDMQQIDGDSGVFLSGAIA